MTNFLVDYPVYIFSSVFEKRQIAFDPSLLPKRMTIPVQTIKRHAPLIMAPFTLVDISEALTTLFSAERTAFMFAADYCQKDKLKMSTVSSSIPTPQNPFSPCSAAVSSMYAAARVFLPLPIACSTSSRTSS